MLDEEGPQGESTAHRLATVATIEREGLRPMALTLIDLAQLVFERKVMKFVAHYVGCSE